MKGAFWHKLLPILFSMCMVFAVVPSIGHALTISGNNVGIGTNTPSQPLDVVGNINTSGNVTASGSLSGGSISGNGSGLTNLNPANLSGGTANINILGNAVTATTANAVVSGGVTTAMMQNSSVTAPKIGFYAKVAIVDYTGGGDYTDPYQAMANYSSWCGTPSATNPCLVKIMPGVYTVTSPVVMQPYVDIEGSGENTTKITGALSSSVFPPNICTVRGSSNSELRFLTVENTGTGLYTYTIFNSSQSPSILHVTVTASGGNTNNYGVYNYSSSKPTMTNVTVTASGGNTNNYGVYNDSSSSPTMMNVTVTASGGTNNTGVLNNPSSSPTMMNVTVTVSGGTNNGVVNLDSSPTMMNVKVTVSAGTNYGVYNYSSSPSSSPTMMNVTVTVSGGTNNNNYGVYNYSSSPSYSPTMINVMVTASGGTNNNNYGVYNESSSPTMTNVTVNVKEGTNNRGVFNSSSSSPTMTNVTVSAKGGTNSYGVYNDGSAPVIRDVLTSATDALEYNAAIENWYNSHPILSNVTANASGGTYAFGLFNTGSAGPVDIERSTFSAVGGTGDTKGIRNDSSQSIKVGSSMIVGGAAGTVGTLSCIYSYDGNYGSLNAFCQ